MNISYTERPTQRLTYNIQNRTILSSKQTSVTHRDRDSLIYFLQPKQVPLSSITNTNLNQTKLFRGKTEYNETNAAQNTFVKNCKENEIWEKVNINKNLKQIHTKNRKRNRFFKSHFDKKQQPQIYFKNILLSNKVNHNKIENDTKISKLYKLSHKKQNFVMNIQINGQKAPKQQIIDHFKIKKSQSNPNLTKLTKIKLNIT